MGWNDDEDVHAIFKAFHSFKDGKNIIHYSSKMRERKREPQMEHKMPALQGKIYIIFRKRKEINDQMWRMKNRQKSRMTVGFSPGQLDK